MKKLLKVNLLILIVSLALTSCGGPQKSSSEGDSGDSATLGTGPDTTGTTVDTGSTVTDSL